MSTVYEELLEWSQSIPVWQRDALRRLVRGLQPEDFEELRHLCLSAFQLAVPGCKDVQAEPLTAQHLPSPKTAASSVTLHSICSVENVNLLDPESTLNFSPKGLTIVYGDNGSGKSGYTRILKKMCRARDAGGPIHPNIFEEPSGEPACACIAYSVGEAEPTTFDWVYEQEAPIDFSRISIFDTDCADFYVTKYNDIAYRPFGLDLFDRLASLADDIQRELEHDKNSVASKCPGVPEDIDEAVIIRSLFPLGIGTKMADIVNAAQWSDANSAELKRLVKLLREENPATKAAAVRARKSIVEEFRKRVDGINSTLSGDQYVVYRKDIDDLATAKETARVVSQQAFSDCLPGTGSDPWKQLWEYARRYSEGLAYPSIPFPNIGDDALCVLCQQPLLAEARQRLLLFADYIKQESAKRLETCEQAIEKDQSKVRQLITTAESDNGMYEELTVHSVDLRESVRQYLSKAATAQAELLCALVSGNWRSVQPCSFDTSVLSGIIAALEEEARSWDTNSDRASVTKAEETLLELRAKQWLNANLSHLQQELARLERAGKIDKAIATTKTTGISRKATELTNKYVTADLQVRIKTELKGINASGLRITLTGKTDKGSKLHRVDIDGKTIPDSEVKDVVSEGEYRAIALAAFFAELGQSPDKSSIVVDDPVCSLDHIHRGRVAARLVKEASVRQVIILTHDLVFLDDLLREAGRQMIDYKTCYVLRRQEHVGVVCEGLPWIGQAVKTRIPTLKKDLSRLEALYSEDPGSNEYNRQAKLWYGDLRETWERTIEELVLNSVVIRFSREVQTRRLRKVVELTSADYDTVDEGMSKSSTWLAGHDQPKAVNEPMPPPEELATDLAKLEEYVTALTKRKCEPRSNQPAVQVTSDQPRTDTS